MVRTSMGSIRWLSFWLAISSTSAFAMPAVGLNTQAKVPTAAPQAQVATRIAKVIDPDSSGEPYLVYSMADARVYSVEQTHAALAHSLKEAAARLLPVQLSLSGNEVLSMQNLSKRDLLNYTDDFSGGFSKDDLELVSNDGSYTPTVFSSMAPVQRIFDAMPTKFRFPSRRSQCYQRAQVWAYDLFRSQGVKTMKVFLFYSQRYMKQVDKKWWFHVAPYTFVGNTEVVLDPTFTDSPLTINQWTSKMSKTHSHCPLVGSYQEYERRNGSPSEYCHIRKVPMYYYQPKDIEESDTSGVPITRFRAEDLRHADQVRP